MGEIGKKGKVSMEAQGGGRKRGNGIDGHQNSTNIEILPERGIYLRP